MNSQVYQFLFIVITLLPLSCNGQPKNDALMNESHKHTNDLINESSPYLLQHAHNPVDWMPWGREAFEKAERENKLVLISIGYAACHWCHVMEHESFEDSTVAALMNEHYVCIKVDREERPDVDEIYMTAVQLMTGRGGWPLNCFTLPDGRPFYGGTYFQKGQWMNVLTSLYDTYQNDPQKILDYAENLTEGIKNANIIEVESTENVVDASILNEMVVNWKRGFDNKDGGPNKAPKFPLPNNYQFLLRYAALTNNKEVADHVKITLNKMAWGGIYDQIGGGFARYSTDVNWKVPHFEKMLYDNAQLITLYSEAYQATKEDLYKEIVYQSIDFINKELRNPNGGFYSSLDADSEGIEGKYYVWTEKELQELLNEEQYQFVKKYYNLNSKGYWEHENYILLRDESDADYAEKNDLAISAVKSKKKQLDALLLKEREKRIHPGLDDKILTSWNGLMIGALCDAYRVFNDEAFLNAAEKEMAFILEKQLKEDGALMHSYKNGNSTINGFLEDYSAVIEALIKLYTCTFNEDYLTKAIQLTDYSLVHFYDEKSNMFYFTSDIDDPLLARSYETNDNVIPASNSIMANNLFTLGHYFDNNAYLKTSSAMLNNMANKMHTYGPSYSNWGILMLHHTHPFYEVAITGKDFKKKFIELDTYYLPNKMILGADKKSELVLLEGKFTDETLIYVCVNKACQLPVKEVNEAVKQIIY
jgi:uncharacterized protein YyaL (SSP411 family)